MICVSVFKRSILSLLLSAASLTAYADAAPPAVLTGKLPPGFVVVRSFQAVEGLTGWVVQGPKGPPNIAYTTADGKYLIFGRIIDQAGQDVSAGYQQAMTPKVDIASFWPKVEKSAYLIEGPVKPKAVMYAFMDPNCIYCHLLWKAVQPYEKRGLQVRWIPVALIKPDSGGKAAALLQAKDPAAAMHRLQTRYQEATESGGINPIKPSSAVDAQIRQNGDLMQAMGLYGTPAIVWQETASGKVTGSAGMMKLSTIAKIAGVDELPEADPELKPYK